jgi:hypothetical protein
MSHLRLEHLKINELPPQWAKQLPAAQTFTVIIIAENKPSMPEQVTIEQPSDGIGQDDNTPEEREAYLQYLRSQGINLERLRESIDEYKAGKAEILDWDEFE